MSYYEIGSGTTSVFSGSRYQRGMGLGSMFRSFFRWLVPVMKTHAVPLFREGAKAVGTEAVKTASNLAIDAVAGRNAAESMKERAQEAIESLSSKAQTTIQSRKGYKRRRRRIGSTNKIKKSKNQFEEFFQ